MFGFFFTWLAGVGRYWDNPRAELWQTLGLGSVAYVFVLGAILYWLLAPLGPKNWSYRNVVLFLTLTSPPAVLYAIPVERFLGASDAMSVNAWFLAIVATWRVALLAVFLRRTAALSPGAVVVATLLPLTVIVVTLSVLNLEHVVFRFMSGIPAGMESSNDVAYEVVQQLSLLSILMAPVLFLAYCRLVARAWIAEAEGRGS